MFNYNNQSQKTIIVVAKSSNELLVNKMKQDALKTIPDLKIVTWDEPTWKANKKKGNIESKVIFIGDVKGDKNLIPLFENPFNEYGVKYGWAGKQAAIYVDLKEIQKNYDEFYDHLTVYSVPEKLKKRVDPTKIVIDDTELVEDSEKKLEVEIDADYTENETFPEGDVSIDIVSEDSNENDTELVTGDAKKGKKVLDFVHKISEGIGETAKKARDGLVVAGNAVGESVKSTSHEIFKDRITLKQQALFYGVVKFCEKGISEFINE